MIRIWKYLFCRGSFHFACVNVGKFDSISFNCSVLFARSRGEYTIPEMLRLCLIELILLHLLLGNTTKKVPNTSLNRYS